MTKYLPAFVFYSILCVSLTMNIVLMNDDISITRAILLVILAIFVCATTMIYFNSNHKYTDAMAKTDEEYFKSKKAHDIVRLAKDVNSERKPGPIFLICGYSGHDTNMFGMQMCNDRIDPTWKILMAPGDDFDFYPYSMVFYAFGVNVKTRTHEYLKLDGVKFDSFEYVMDKAMFEDPNDQSDLRTIREWYIKIAARERAMDPNCFKDIVYKSIKHNDHPKGVVGHVVMDWRYPNEHKEGTVTIRVHREGVAIPEHESDHHLDDILTRFVFFTGDEQRIKERFPQYKDYVLSD